MSSPPADSPWTSSSREQIKQDKRDAVLRTAARVFAERGYHGTSLDLVAEELGITRTAVYYYFRTKDEILFECVRTALRLIGEATQEVTAQGGTAAEQLRAALIRYAEIIMMDAGRCLVLIGDDPLPPEGREKLRGLMSGVDRKLRDLITRGVKDGVFTPCDPKVATFAVAGALNSIVKWYRPDGPLSPREVAEQFVTILMRGLASHPESPADGSRAPRLNG